jgi:hypothetical protein
MLASAPLIKPAGSQPGTMTAKVWTATLQPLIDQKIIYRHCGNSAGLKLNAYE